MGKEDVRAVKLRVTDIVCDQYMACRKLGEGGCGVIYEVFNMTRPDEHYAAKAELSGRNTEEEILKLEGKVMRLLNDAGTKHAPRIMKEGTERNYNYLIMSLLGPSVSDLRKQLPEGKFTLFTSLAVGVQGMDAIKEMHNVGYLHRDVKPSNLTIGLMGTSRERFVYLVDFGLARKFRSTRFDGKQELRKKRKTVPFRGTLRYCSLNVHSQEEQGRHDDLFSLVYMLIEMILGNLPWCNMDRAETEKSKVDSEQELLAKLPKEFEIIVTHLKNLNYSLTPNYELIRALVCRVLLRDCTQKMKFDWESGGEFEKILRKQALLHSEFEKSCPPLTEILALNRTTANLKEDTIPIIHPEDAAMTHSSIDDTVETPSNGAQKEAKNQKKKSKVAVNSGKMSGSNNNKYAYKAKSRPSESLQKHD